MNVLFQERELGENEVKLSEINKRKAGNLQLPWRSCLKNKPKQTPNVLKPKQKTTNIKEETTTAKCVTPLMKKTLVQQWNHHWQFSEIIGSAQVIFKKSNNMLSSPYHQEGYLEQDGSDVLSL